MICSPLGGMPHSRPFATIVSSAQIASEATAFLKFVLWNDPDHAAARTARTDYITFSGAGACRIADGSLRHMLTWQFDARRHASVLPDRATSRHAGGNKIRSHWRIDRHGAGFVASSGIALPQSPEQKPPPLLPLPQSPAPPTSTRDCHPPPVTF